MEKAQGEREREDMRSEEAVVQEKVMDISLKELSRKLEEFAKARDWEKYHSPRNLLLAMVVFHFFFVLLSLHGYFLHILFNLVEFYYALSKFNTPYYYSST